MSYMQDWLCSTYDSAVQQEDWLYKHRTPVTVVERFAFLKYAKGTGSRVTWGAIAFGEGPWGRTGLSQNEALELIYLYGVRDGIALFEGPQAISEFQTAILEETRRVAEEQGYSGDDDDANDG